MKEECYWFATTDAPSFSKDQLPDSVDVVVVGGGIAGLSTAYNLGRMGKSVLVLEKGRVGMGATGQSTGMLVLENAAGYAAMEAVAGQEKTRRIFDSLAYSLDQIEELIEREKIECGFRKTSSLVVTNGVYSALETRNEYEARKRYGLNMDWLSEEELGENFPMLRAKEAMKTNGEAVLDPYQFVIELARRVSRNGGEIAEGVEYLSHSANDDGVLVETSHGEIRAKDFVLASDNDLEKLVSRAGPSIVVQMTVIVTEPIDIMRGWNNGEMIVNSYPMFEYTRRLSDGRVLFSSGRSARFPGEQDSDNVHYLVERAFREFFHLPEVKVDYVWDGVLAFNNDALPYIDEVSPHVYACGGYNGHGILFGSLAGELIARMILHEPHPYGDLFGIEEHGSKWHKKMARHLPGGAKHIAARTELDGLLNDDLKAREKDGYFKGVV